MLTTSVSIDKAPIRKAQFMVETEDGFKEATLFRNSKNEGDIVFTMWSKDWEKIKSWKHKLCRQSMLSMAEWISG